MHGCITPIGSITARWLVAANRFYSSSASSLQLRPPSQDDNTFLSRWRPSRASLHPKYKQHPPLLAHSAAIATEQTRQTSNRSWQPIQQEPSETNKPLPSAPQIEPEAITGKDASLAPRPAARERRPLPLSPLMDPAAIAAKQRHRAPKAQPSKNPEPFQQMLAKNPYALALATPLRRDHLTQRRFPSFFLQDFSLMAHPETGDPWYVPRSLTNKHAPAAIADSTDLDIEPEMELEPKGERQPDSQPEKIGRKPTPDIGFSIYTLSSQLAIRAVIDKEGFAQPSWSKGADRQVRQMGIPLTTHVRLVPDRYNRAKLASKVLSKAAWRTDMHEFVLELLRRRTLEDLVHVSKLKRGYVVACTDWEDAKAKPQVGAFLWTGGNGDIEVDDPPEFATLEVRTQVDKTRKVPVHNLRSLLGREKLAELREKLPSGIFQKEILILRHKKVTVGLEMRLWKLQGYLAEYREIFRDGEEQDEMDD